MNSPTTPMLSTSSSTLHAEPRVYLSKTAFIRMIQEIPFDNIGVPQSVVNDQPESAAAFLKAAGFELVDTLIKSSPDKASPVQFISGTPSFHHYTSEPDSLTKRPRVKDPNSVGIPFGIFSLEYNTNHKVITVEQPDARMLSTFSSAQEDNQLEHLKQLKNGTRGVWSNANRNR